MLKIKWLLQRRRKKMITYYVKNGDRRIFNPGFSKGFIRLKTAEMVRVVYSKKEKDGQPGPLEEIPVGDVQGVPVQDIYAGSLEMIPLSEQTGYCALENINNSRNVMDAIEYRTISCPVILDCDADRDGIVGYNEEGKANWTWDPKGRGAILMVNNDKDKSGESPFSHSSEYADLLVRSTGYDKKAWENLGLELRLYATPLAVKRFAVYRVKPDGKLEKVLPDDVAKKKNGEINISKELCHNGERLLVEAHQYPGQCPHTEETHDGICWDSHFEGLITIELHLRKKIKNLPKGILLESDRVVFRVAPWIMVPNTRPVKKVYVARITGGKYDNTKFVDQLATICYCLDVDLEVISAECTFFSRWIQDEIECGYSQDIHHHLPVVFASPNGNMMKNVEAENIAANVGATLKNADFGYFTMAGSNPGNLDTFGNLDVSPPVTVRGKHYPLGRIIFGGRSYGSLASEVREMMQKTRRFLYAQKVQSPIEVFTDWLWVGHVDEIICFIPNSFPTPPGEKEFKVLLAWPDRTLALLKTLKAQNQGDKVMFKDKKDSFKLPIETTVNDLFNNDQLWNDNKVFQEHMNLNRAILTKHLDLNHNDFIEIPVLFEKIKDGRAIAYFPNMVNQLVIVHTKKGPKSKKQVFECTSIVPKPFGPEINGKCAFEEAFEKAMPKNHECRFIDDWDSYHVWCGEIQCGTNALRQPPLDVKWWHTLPDEGFNV
jgi:protein-arginine deiminase